MIRHSVPGSLLYRLNFWMGKRSCFLTYIVGDGAHVEHVSACIEHDRALKRVVMYSHDRCPKRVVMYLHVIVIACICVYRAWWGPEEGCHVFAWWGPKKGCHVFAHYIYSMYPRVLSMIGALRGFVMYSHDRCPKRVVMYTHAIEHVSSYIEHGMVHHCFKVDTGYCHFYG